MDLPCPIESHHAYLYTPPMMERGKELPSARQMFLRALCSEVQAAWDMHSAALAAQEEDGKKDGKVETGEG